MVRKNYATENAIWGSKPKELSPFSVTALPLLHALLFRDSILLIVLNRRRRKVRDYAEPRARPFCCSQVSIDPDNEILLNPVQKVLTVFNRDLAYEFNIDS